MEFNAASFRAARSLLGLGQAEVGSRADVDRNVVFRVETGKYQRDLRPQATKLKRFFEREGIEFLDATDNSSTGIRWQVGKIDVLVQREHLRAGRAIAGLLQADLAAKAEVSQSLISRFESGKTQSISSSEFEKLVLGLSKAGVEVFNDPQKGVAEVRIRTLNHF